MERIELIAPCHFGLEAVLKREIQDLGYEISNVEDGRVSFYGDAEAICRANIFLRTAERVLLKVGSFKAVTFEELFEYTKKIPWEKYVPKDGKFWVTKAASVKSKLFSPSDIQSIMKKAMVNRMREHYHVDWFEESGASYPVRVFLMKDIVTVGIDTSGVSLHKRGYRQLSSKAPITETLAAALIMLTPWRRDRILVDPFCGSGTFPIEAAMIAANIAPGMNRSFTAEEWSNLIPKKAWYDAIDEAFCGSGTFPIEAAMIAANIAPGMNRSFTAEEWSNLIPKKAWYDAIDEANSLINDDIEVDIQGYDIDGDVVRAARENAKEAGVDHLIHFQERAVKDLRHPKKYGFIITNPPYGERLEEKENLPGLYKEFGDHLIHFQERAVKDLRHPKKYGFIITNPPYGERLEEKENLPGLYKEFGDSFRNLDSWSAYMITSYEDTEKYFGRKADKNRKIYNGMLKTYFYQFLGPKPPKQKK